MIKFFKAIFKTILGLATFVGLAVLCLAVLGALSFRDVLKESDEFASLPEKITLIHSIKGALPEMSSMSYLDHVFGGERLSLYDFLRALDKAKNDDRVKRLAVMIKDGDYSLTQLQAMRNAVLDFRASGKSAVIYTASFGGFSNGIAEYWFASAFDTIIVQPAGTVSLNGIYIEQPYARGALDKIGVEPQMMQRKAYKTGPETYTRNNMSEESKETLVSIAEGMMKVIVKDISSSRELDIAKVAAAIHQSPLSPEGALKAGLIDSILHYDEVEKGFIQDDEVSLSRYVQELNGAGEAAVAYIPVHGMILDAEPSIKAAPMAFVFPDDIAESDMVAADIMDAAEDDDVKVILLSINSPGGSPTASETIRRAVVYAREQGKYVIAAMGDVAASGGYWIATHANQIIASDLTITGSIGVYGGKMNLKGLWSKLGMNWEAVKIGQNAGLWSMNAPYSESERARIAAMMDQVYADFVTRVAEGRNLPADKVEEAAQGRAWIGADARTKGLVDLAGGFDFALKRAAAEAGGLDWAEMNFVNMQATPDPIEELMDMIGMGGMPISSGIQIPKALLPAVIPQAVVTAPSLKVEF